MFSPSTKIFDKYYEVMDWFLDCPYISSYCTIVYPPKLEECANCVAQLTGSTSTNVYRHGGPAPFSFGICPICGGNGYREVEVTDNIRLRTYWSKKDWSRISNIVAIPDADVMIIGYLSDLSKIRSAIEIRLISNRAEGPWRFRLSGETFPHGFGKNRYFIGFVKRV